MTETMKDLKARAKQWPGKWGRAARELITDAQCDLAVCQTQHVPLVIADLRRALLAIEEERSYRSDEAHNIQR